MTTSAVSTSGRAATRALTLALLASAASPSLGQTVIFEKFNQSGTAWTDSVFSQVSLGASSSLERGQTLAGMGAPNTTPVLPVNEGGDKEGRFFLSAVSSSSTYAFTPADPANELTDCLIDGYIGLGVNTLSGVRGTGLLVRANDAGAVNGYMAYLVHDAGGSGSLRIARVRDGIITIADTYASSDSFPMTTGDENYHLYFSVNGPDLEARLARVEIVGGIVRESRVDLSSDPGTQDTLLASDTEILSGRVGARFFSSTTADNSIFLDDVDIVERACDNIVNTESQTLGVSWGSAAGNSPGDIVFTEDAIPVRVFEFQIPGGASTFGTASVQRTFEQVGFGRILQLNNICAGFNFSGIGRAGRVAIEFGDFGGFENLIVNNSPVYIGEIAAVPFNFAPGITATVSTTTVTGGIRGVLTLQGNIFNVRIGGQEFFIDDVCAAVTCPCDINADFFLNSQDFFDFLTDFFGGSADYNLDGFTNSQDFFDFLTCFFSGCI